MISGLLPIDRPNYAAASKATLATCKKRHNITLVLLVLGVKPHDLVPGVNAFLYPITFFWHPTKHTGKNKMHSDLGARANMSVHHPSYFVNSEDHASLTTSN